MLIAQRGTSRLGALASPHSPVGHVQEEGATGGVELEAQQSLKLRDEDVLVRGAHAAEFLHELRVHVHVRALHGWRVSRGRDGVVRGRGVLSQLTPRPYPAITTQQQQSPVRMAQPGGRCLTLQHRERHLRTSSVAIWRHLSHWFINEIWISHCGAHYFKFRYSFYFLAFKKYIYV